MGLENRIVYNLVDVIEGNCRIKQALIKDKRDVYKRQLQIHGIGPVKAVQILCAVELSKRLARESKCNATNFSRPEQLAAYFMDEMRNLETEHLYLAALDASGRLLYDKAVFKGTINYSVVNPRETVSYTHLDTMETTNQTDAILFELRDINLSNVTPMDAMNLVYKWQNKLKEQW